MKVEEPYSEEELLLRSIRGDAAAFAELYEAHRDKVFAFAFTLCKSADTATEVVQEVFVRLWERRAQIEPGHSFAAYLRKITYHEVLGFFRKARRDRTLQDQLYANMQALQESTPDELIGKELARLYQEAIDRLPTQKKQVYLLSRDAGLRYEDIAAQLGLSRNTVRNHMTEAIRQIRAYVSTHRDLAVLVLAICLR
ncbi:RNA polymerase sigma factor [Chitinophaga lutea]